MKIIECMTKSVVTLPETTSLPKALQLMKQKKIGSVLVSRKKKIVGIFTERDLINRLDYAQPEKVKDVRLKDIMTSKLKTVAFSKTYDEVIELMQRYRIRHMPISKNGKIIGMVSLRDLLSRYQEILVQQLQLREEEILRHIEQIKESEEKFRTIFNNSAVSITFFDKNERLVAWNPFAVQLLGIAESQLKGRNIREFCPAEEWARIKALNIRQMGAKQIETKIATGRGEVIDVDASIRVLKDAEGAVMGTVAIMSDITERKRMDRLKEEFVSVVSHELRTPLLPIREGVSQVLDGLLGPTTDDQRKYLSLVLSEIDRLNRIINDLLDIFKFEAGRGQLKKEYIDLVSVAKNVVSTFEPRLKDRAVALKTVFPSESVIVYADKDRITQVFTNLVSNALKFTEKGSIEICLVRQDKAVECRVKDTGKGIRKSDLSKLFRKFEQFSIDSQRKELGTGLGLVICKNIVELHKGDIRAESAYAKGTTFIFTLPYYTAEDIFREHVEQRLREAMEKGGYFSLLSFDIQDVEAFKGKFPPHDVRALLDAVEAIVKSNSRCSEERDSVVRSETGIMILLGQTRRQFVEAVSDRICSALDQLLAERKLENEVRYAHRQASFPDDGRTIDELFDKINKL